MIRIVGDHLADDICRPFSHLRIEENHQAPQLTIDFWDDQKGPNPRQIPARENLLWTETTVRSHNNLFVGENLPHTFSCLNRRGGHLMASIAWRDRMFIYERAKPLARLLLDWYNGLNLQVIHAGLVAHAGNGVIFAGKSGSGKSTTSLACVCGGLGYLSEDYVALEQLRDGSFVGHSVYNSIFLETSHLMRFTDLIPYAIKGERPAEEKSVIVLSQVFPERLERSVPIRALALVRAGIASESRFRKASKGEALLAVGPSSLLQIPNRGLGVRGFTKLAQLVECVPCYWLETAGDLTSIAGCVKQLLGEVTS